VHQHGLSRRNPLVAEIATGLIELHEQESGEVVVAMGQTRHAPEAVGFDAAGRGSSPCGADTLWHPPLPAGDEARLSLVAIPSLDAVQAADDDARAALAGVGPFIESHERCAHRVNVGFMQSIDRQTIRLRVYERGAGETLACGTGACAAV